MNLYTMKNIQKLKQNPMKGKSTQILMVIRNQKKVFNMFAY